MASDQLVLSTPAIAADLFDASELVGRALAIITPHGQLFGGVRFCANDLTGANDLLRRIADNLQGWSTS